MIAVVEFLAAWLPHTVIAVCLVTAIRRLWWEFS